MSKLFLLRHLKSQWNQDNRFAGWVDNPLSREGILAAKEISDKLADVKIDVVYTSPLIRNKETVLRVFENLALSGAEEFQNKYPLFIHLDGGRMQKWGNFKGGGNYVPVYVCENLNERYYGKLQGLNKDEVIQKYGGQQVRLWRRGFEDAPPGGESLKNIYKRAVSFFKKYIDKDLVSGKNVLVVASHNSLRVIVKYIEDIYNKDIADVELAFGSLLKYEFSGGLNLISKKYFSTN